MRILHIDTGHDMRGGQWQALHLLQGLAQRGVPARLLAPADSALLQAGRSLSLDVRPLRPLSLPFAAGGFDLLHAHDAHAHTLALSTRRPLIVSRRVAFPVGRAWFSRLKYRQPVHYLAVSEYVKQELIQANIPSEKITIVYDGVRTPDRNKAETRSQVVALDSDDPAKGKALVEEAAALAGVAVHFSSQLLQDLPHARLFVYATELEGLGSAALLAMAYEVPVVASNTGGLPEIVVDGETGLLTDNTPEAVARAMRRLLTDRVFAQRMAARGRTLVERKFTVTHMVENTLAAYERVLS